MREPGCINMSKTTLLRYFAGSLQQKFWNKAKCQMIVFPVPSLTYLLNKELLRLLISWIWMSGQKPTGLGRAFRGTVADLFLSASCELSVGPNIGGLNVEFLQVEYLQEQTVGKANSFLACSRAFYFPLIFSPI